MKYVRKLLRSEKHHLEVITPESIEPPRTIVHLQHFNTRNKKYTKVDLGMNFLSNALVSSYVRVCRCTNQIWRHRQEELTTCRRSAVSCTWQNVKEMLQHVPRSAEKRSKLMLNLMRYLQGLCFYSTSQVSSTKQDAEHKVSSKLCGLFCFFKLSSVYLVH